MNETQQCHYCKEEYPYPVELHHSETECALNTIADLQRQLADAQAQKGELIGRALEHAGLILNREKDQWECFCGESLGTYVIPYEERRKLTSLDTELTFARVKHRDHIREELDPASTSAWNERLRRERLDEATWWAERVNHHPPPDPKDCDLCRRLNELRAALSAPEDRHGTAGADAIEADRRRVTNILCTFEREALSEHSHGGGIEYLNLALKCRVAIKQIKEEIAIPPAPADKLVEALRKRCEQWGNEIDILRSSDRPNGAEWASRLERIKNQVESAIEQGRGAGTEDMSRRGHGSEFGNARPSAQTEHE